jgi:hypothetical protein
MIMCQNIIQRKNTWVSVSTERVTLLKGSYRSSGLLNFCRVYRRGEEASKNKAKSSALNSLPRDTGKLQSHSTMPGKFTPDLGVKQAKGPLRIKQLLFPESLL